MVCPRQDGSGKMDSNEWNTLPATSHITYQRLWDKKITSLSREFCHKSAETVLGDRKLLPVSPLEDAMGLIQSINRLKGPDPTVGFRMKVDSNLLIRLFSGLSWLGRKK